MFDEMVQRVLARGGTSWIDLSLTAINNPQTPQLGKRMGAEICKVYCVMKWDGLSRRGIKMTMP